MTTGAKRAFTDPHAVETPAGAEGWERMYPYYGLLSEERRELEQSKFWFFDGMHNPTPIFPFDTIMTENWWVAVNQLTTRVWCIPPAGGIDHRFINGYLYISPNPHPEPDRIAERAEIFTRRAGHYYENWDEIYEQWVAKAQDCIARLEAISFAPHPDVEAEEKVTGHVALYSTFDLARTYDELIQNMFEMGAYHFEMLNLGYGAYLTFREFCQEAFPGITDQTVARMVAGIDIMLFRPDDEVRKLAALAREQGLADVVQDKADDPQALLAAMAERDGGQAWLDAFEAAQDPWFWYSTGAGYTHTDRAWRDDLRLPFNALRGYVEKLERGEAIERPLETITEERGRITAEYRELLPTDDDREAFDELVELARTVYPYVENHNFYVEHWHHGLFWNKVRELGDVFVAHGFFADREDIFLLHRDEVRAALYDLNIGWATMSEARGPSYWPPEIARRKEMLEALGRWTPPPALGVPPEAVTEPLSIMLWGITQETVDEWLGSTADGDGDLRGVAASPGKARGRARVVTTAAELHEVEPGDILVCRVTAPSWAPVFSKVAAAVSDLGGIMAHTAIVSREYGLPAVVGTGYGTQRIATGQMVEVDGDRGIVRIVEEAPAA
jgi:pyruvate, water dikinase